MILGKVGVTVNDDFTVTDSNDQLVPGLDSTAFTYHIFDSNGSDSSITTPVTITPLGYGHYRASFVPNSVGMWMLSVYNATHFPWGKTGNIQVFANDFDSIATVLTRILGLSQENYYVDNTTFDSNNNLTYSRVRIYSDAASVGTSNNVIETYEMNATYTNNNMETYELKKL